MGRTALTAVEIIAASIWIGSMVCLAVVSSIARRELDPPARVQLFRGIGRAYGVAGTAALVVAILAGAILAGRPSTWSTALWISAGLSVVLVVLTMAGMAQARRMTAARRASIAAPDDVRAAEQVRRGSRSAGILRSLMGVTTLAVVVLVAHELSA